MSDIGPENIQPEPVEEPVSSAGQFSAERDIVAGRDIAGRDIAGHDIAGRDIYNTTTNIGFNQNTVLRLVIAVGLIVFLTAGCFFSGGIVVGVGALLALNRDVPVTVASSASMQMKLADLQNTPPDTPFALSFSEEEINSYFHEVVAPDLNITNGKIRLLSPGELIVAGDASKLSNLPFAATFRVVTGQPGQTLKLVGAAVDLLPFTNGSFGWVAVPTAVLAPVAEQINDYLGGHFIINDVSGGTSGLTGPPSDWILKGITVGQN
jgi:hypothetical protein